MKKLFLFLPFLFLTGYIQALEDVKFSAEHTTNFLISSPSDYFRSVQSGDWGTLTTWESSPDNATWAAATLIPNNAANTISIKNGHTVTVSTSQDMDQVVIESGGILLHAGGILTVHDGAGDDIIVQGGGQFTLSVVSNPPVFSPLAATTSIETNAVLRVTAGGMTGPGTGVNASNYIYRHASVLELTIAFTTNNAVYFPNVDAVTIPVFRAVTNLAVGSANPTVFNGLFEAVGNVTFQNTGTKTFRNGIVGTGNVNGSTSAKFIINGVTADLGGNGLLTLPVVDGMDIGSSTTVTMISDKSVTGNMALLSNTLVNLGNFNLTMTGAITGGSATSHIITNGTGKLVINNIGATPVTFPIGYNAATYNPLVIANGSGLHYGARVEVGINPAIAIPLRAVNRTWVIGPSATPGGNVNVNFFYDGTHGNGSFNYSSPVELGFYDVAWNVINTGLTQLPAYEVATTVNLFFANSDASFVIGNPWSILALSDPVTVNYFNGAKQNGNHVLTWKLTCNSTPAVNMVLERSADAINYLPVYAAYASALRCEQPFTYTDDKPAAGTNYYRLKMIDVDGKTSYSAVVSLTNTSKAFQMISIAPNPVTAGRFTLKINAAKNERMQIIISDMQGRTVQQELVVLSPGINNIPVQVNNPVAGTYQLYGLKEDKRSNMVRFVIQ